MRMEMTEEQERIKKETEMESGLVYNVYFENNGKIKVYNIFLL